MNRVKEQSIVKALAQQDAAAALKAIMGLYHEMLYWHIRKLVMVHEDADDVLQNTYMKIYKGLPNFKQKSSVKTWVYRIAYNESMRHLEKAGKQGMVLSEEMTENYWGKLRADPYFDADACEERLHGFMAELPERKRQIFVMKYFEELTFEGIADLLKMNTNSVKTSFYAMKKQLEEQMKTAI